ncbi:MAG: SpoIIE family protein phosphatase [Akkermansiaceae bacterium]|nr:SpoIIE family protein phosphatase [Armatimonadota bacterium]
MGMYNTARLLDSYREASEDRAEFVPLPEDALALIIADGVGGRENGGDAATRAVELTHGSVTTATTRELSDPRFWEQMFRRVDEAVSNNETCGETTLVALCMTPSRITGASVGDSEAWWVSETGSVRVLTEGGRKPYLGRGMSVPVTFALSTPPTGTLLAATDGLFKYTDAGQIARVVSRGASDLQVVAPALRGLARSSSGVLHDDFAVLLASVEEQAPAKHTPPSLWERIAGAFAR